MPRKTRLRRRLLVLIAAALTILGLTTTPAFADATPEVSLSMGATSVAVGQTFTVTVQFTNAQTTDINFIYQSLSPDWTTSQETGLSYAAQSCAGSDSWCDLAGQTVEWYDSPPIAPAASQSVTLTYEVLPGSACGANTITLDFYDYDEYNSDTNNESALFATAPVNVTCT